MQNNETIENLGIDPNDAPEGFIAVESSHNSCNLCYFNTRLYCKSGNHPNSSCTARKRNDGKYVIFIKKQDTKATLSYPCGSLGEEIE